MPLISWILAPLGLHFCGNTLHAMQLVCTPLHYILFTYCNALDILSTIKENWGYFCILSMYVKPWTPFTYDLLEKSFHVHFLHLICFDSHFEIPNKQVWIWKCGFTFWLFPTNNPLHYHAYYHLTWLHLYHWENDCLWIWFTHHGHLH